MRIGNQQNVSFFQDVSSRPGRYIYDLRKSSAISFSGGNTAFSGATGIIGGFALGGVAAAGIQALVTLYISNKQMQATYTGEGYAAPPKLLGHANMATAAALITGGIITGTPLAIGLASASAAVLMAWGKGHYDLHNFLSCLEELQKQGKAEGLSEQQLKDLISNDPLVKKYEKHFQVYYGIADVGAITTAAAKGETLIEVGANFMQQMASFESVIPIIFFGMGIKKSFDLKVPYECIASGFFEKVLPKNVKKIYESPNLSYSTGYAMAGSLFAFNSIAAVTDSQIAQGFFAQVPASVMNIASTEWLKMSAFFCWAHAYYALHTGNQKKPESAVEYQEKRKLLNVQPS